MKIAFIGAGVMGEALIKGVLAKGLSKPEELIANDVSVSRLETIGSNYRIKTSNDHANAVREADAIVLAVKPQDLNELMPKLKGKVGDDQLVLSIIAGAKLATIAGGLEHNTVVRAMPNTPAQVGAGTCVWTAAVGVDERHKTAAKSILGALGTEIYVPNEEYIDMATAISGSGPAYIYLFMESLIEAAISIGLPRQMAQELVLETVLGAAHLAKKTGKQPGELRQHVTSPGGTTEAALSELYAGDVEGLINRAVTAAYERSKELGK